MELCTDAKRFYRENKIPIYLYLKIIPRGNLIRKTRFNKNIELLKEVFLVEYSKKQPGSIRYNCIYIIAYYADLTWESRSPGHSLNFISYSFFISAGLSVKTNLLAKIAND